MTVTSTQRRTEWLQADGVNRSWSFDFRYYDPDHIQLWARVGATSYQVSPSAYSLTPNTGNSIDGYAGGTIIHPLEPATPIGPGTEFRIERVVPYLQNNIDLGITSGWDPRLIEKQLDLSVMMAQQARDNFFRFSEIALRDVLVVGEWDASSGAFPTQRPDTSTIEAGDTWIVSVDGTVDEVNFAVPDRLIALQDGGGATYNGNWLRVGYSDIFFSTVPYIGSIENPVDYIYLNTLHVYDRLHVFSEAYQWSLLGDGDRLRFYFNNSEGPNGGIYVKAGGQFYAPEILTRDLVRWFDDSHEIQAEWEYTAGKGRITWLYDSVLGMQFRFDPEGATVRAAGFSSLGSGDTVLTSDDGAQKITLFNTSNSIGFRVGDVNRVGLTANVLRPAFGQTVSLGEPGTPWADIHADGALYFTSVPGPVDPAQPGRVYVDGDGFLKLSSG